MECSQAVLMLMLLVPCEQSGGESPETVIAEQHKAAPVVQAARAADQRLPVETVLPATANATEASKVARPEQVEPAERNPLSDHRVAD